MADLFGLLFTLYAIFTFAIVSLVYKKNLEKTQPKANLFFRLVCTSFSTFFLSLIFGNYLFLRSFNQSTLIDYLVACFISGLSVTFGDLFYYKALKKIDSSRAYPLIQLSLIFVIFFSFFFFSEEITFPITIGGLLILSSVFILSSKDKEKKSNSTRKIKEKLSDDLSLGICYAIFTAVLWAIAIISFNQARIISNDVFVTNFFRVIFSTIFIAILGIYQREYYAGFKKENREYLKYYIYIGLGGVFSLGLADTLYYKAAELNGLILTSTLTVNTPIIQQFFSIVILKEKFRKRFLIAIFLIVLGNYIILFL